MVFENLVRKVIISTFVISFFFSLPFADAGKPVPPCKECQAAYSPGKTKDIDALIITDKDCSFCTTQVPRELLKSRFPGIKFKTVDYKERQAKKFIAQYKIQTLPYFLIDDLIKKEESFDKFRSIFEQGETKKISLRKELTGICFYLGRKEVEKKIDLFLDFYQKGAGETLDTLISFSRENKISLDLYFIVPQDKKIGYPKEEVRAALAIRKLYPNEFNNYVSWRIKDIENSSWVDTADKKGLNYKKVINLMESSAMAKLISRNKQLAEEVMVKDGNVILVKNNRIFRIVSIDKEELKSFFKGGR